MNFETFRGRDMGEAVAAIKAAFGPNAVIGVTRRVTNGRGGGLGQSFVEVQAAPAPAGGDAPIAAPTPVRARSTSVPRSSVTEAWAPPTLAESVEQQTIADVDRIQRELRSMRAVLEAMGSAQKPRSRAHAILTAAGIEGPLATTLAAVGARAARDGDEAIRKAIRQKIASRVRIAPSPVSLPGPRVVACLGPAGVGKTTTLAKLAARAHLELGRSVAIITLDTWRVGAVDQMRRFAELVGVPLDVAGDRAAFEQALGARHADLVLVDTSGGGPGDRHGVRKLADCLPAVTGRRLDVLLALPAAVRPRDAERFLALPGACAPTGLVVTKVDESDVAGGALHAAVEGNLPVTYLCDGPRVPEDIHEATTLGVLDAVLPVTS